MSEFDSSSKSEDLTGSLAFRLPPEAEKRSRVQKAPSEEVVGTEDTDDDVDQKTMSVIDRNQRRLLRTRQDLISIEEGNMSPQEKKKIVCDKLMMSLEYKLFRREQNKQEKNQWWAKRLASFVKRTVTRPKMASDKFQQWIYDIGQRDSATDEDHRFVIRRRMNNEGVVMPNESHARRHHHMHVVDEMEEFAGILSDEESLYHYMLKLAVGESMYECACASSTNAFLELEERTIVPCVAVVRIDAAFPVSVFGRFGSKLWRLFKPTHLGLCHMSLLFGGCIIEWRLDSLCIPRSTMSKRAMFCVKFEHSPLKVGDLRYVARGIVRWNVHYQYTASPVNAALRSQNCQDFIFDMVEMLQIDWRNEIRRNPHIGRRLSNLRELDLNWKFRYIDLARFQKGAFLVRFLKYYKENLAKERTVSNAPPEAENDGTRDSVPRSRFTRMIGCCLAPYSSIVRRFRWEKSSDSRQDDSDGIKLPDSSQALRRTCFPGRVGVFHFNTHEEFDHFFAKLVRTTEFLSNSEQYRDLWEYAKCFDRAFWLNDRAQEPPDPEGEDLERTTSCPFSNPFAGSFKITNS